jgi:hypothetical protein
MTKIVIGELKEGMILDGYEIEVAEVTIFWTVLARIKEVIGSDAKITSMNFRTNLPYDNSSQQHSEKIKAGLERAIVNGKDIGRPRLGFEPNPEVAALGREKKQKAEEMLARGCGILQVAKVVGLGSGTVQRIKEAMPPVQQIPMGASGKKKPHRKRVGRLTGQQIALQCLPATFDELREIFADEGFAAGSLPATLSELRRSFQIVQQGDTYKLAKPKVPEAVKPMEVVKPAPMETVLNKMAAKGEVEPVAGQPGTYRKVGKLACDA